jgi:hypothetical protein
MKPILLTALLLLSPALSAQELRSGPSAPAANAQIPPSEPRGRSAGDPNQPGAAPGDPAARTGADDARRAPPPGHTVLGGPPVPGARQPERSEGFATDRDPIPPHVGERIRPDASTTGRGR